jgi:hypothetical protein
MYASPEAGHTCPRTVPLGDRTMSRRRRSMTPAAILVALGAAVSQGLSLVAGYATSLDVRIIAVSVVMATVAGIASSPRFKKKYSS